MPPGSFPFPLSGGAVESPYLTWIRNHSNYMAARGILDYLRAAGVLLRGMLVNFTIFLPYLLLLATLLAYQHHWMRAHPYAVTSWVLALAGLWVIGFAMGVPVLRALRHDRAVATGSETTVKQRDRYERSFGALLLVLMVVAAIESVPWVLEWSHDSLQLGDITWKRSLSGAVAGIALLSGSSQLLTLLSGVKRQVAMVLVGLLGLLVPLLVVLAATDYLLYGLTPTFLGMLSPLLVPLLAFLGLVIALVGGLRRRVFTGPEALAIAGLLVVSVGFSWGVANRGLAALEDARQGHTELERTLDMVGQLTATFDSLSPSVDLGPDVAVAVAAGMGADERYDAAIARIESVRKDVALRRRRANWGPAWLRRARVREAEAHLASEYLAAMMPLASIGYRLSGFEDGELEPLRGEIVRLAKQAALRSLDSAAGGSEEASSLLADALVVPQLEFWLELSRPPFEVGAPDPAALVRRRFRADLASGVRAYALSSTQGALHEMDGPFLAALAGEPALLARIDRKFGDAAVSRRAELSGLDSVLALLTREELVELASSPFTSERAPLTRAERAALLRSALPQFSDARTAEDSARVSRLLVDLVNAGADAGTSGRRPVDDTFAHHVAFHVRAPRSPWLRASLSGAAGAGDAAPSDAELGLMASQSLARHALEQLDGDRLIAIATNEAFNEEGGAPAGLVDSLIGSVRSDSARGARLDDFKRLYQSELREIVGPQAVNRAIADADFASRSEAYRDSVRFGLPFEWPHAARRHLVVAARALDHDTETMAWLARRVLMERALAADASPDALRGERDVALEGFALMSPALLRADELATAVAARARRGDRRATDDFVAKLMVGVHATIDQDGLARVKNRVTRHLMRPKVIFIGLVILVLFLGTWIAVDVNLTSVHGLYRDRLASAFLVGRDTRGDVGIEDDLDLEAMARYDQGATVPYHLINVALNLQASRDPGVRDRKSDFFIFSKRFVGGQRTGYARSTTLEQVFPQMDVATAMAISAAAAAPNMGRGTSPFLVAFMTMLNVRLGFWVPHPGRLEDSTRRDRWRGKERRRTPRPPGFTFAEVHRAELLDIAQRRRNAFPDAPARDLDLNGPPTTANGLLGLAFSGGGIRSASLNLGIAQALHRAGVFDHVDLLSTVSGGGYVGSSLSVLMRSKATDPEGAPGSGVASAASVDTATAMFATRARRPRRAERLGLCTAIAGTVQVEEVVTGDRVVTVTSTDGATRHEYRFSRFDDVLVRSGDTVRAGAPLVRRLDTQGSRLAWRVRPTALVREILSRLDERHRWVNLSDGGHIENLATIELLRRRCRFIIIGDGEADPHLRFAGLARLMRYAFLDLGIDIDIDLDALRLRAADEARDAGAVSAAHVAVGTITYPPLDGASEPETGVLLYLKSSFSGDESEVIREYRHRYPDFPHQSTADQMFDEDQFEAYRALGQHIAEQALAVGGHSPVVVGDAFRSVESWFDALRGSALAGAGRAVVRA